MNHNVKCGPQIIVACQGRFIDCYTCTTLVQDADSGAGGAYMCIYGGRRYVGILYVGISTVFCYEPKTTLKKIKSVSPGNGKVSTKANSN